ncbi:MAG: DUF3500 domain-containing protein [Verrucomicrobiaceae bacterium]|nr:MAG: DUF3500 domain-containing protein [Verrucomicrobiaceae bacterium]
MKMKITSLVFCSILLTAPLLSAAPVGNYPSLPSKVLSNYHPKSDSDRTPESFAKSANTFLSSLNKELRAQAALPFDSSEKAKWTNVPPRGPQGGVRLGDLNEAQIKAAVNLLSTVLSEQGYSKARNIPLADDRLLRNGKRRPGFGAEDYWLAIFGKPSPNKPWGLQFDGHHIAINLAFHGDRMSMSPTFIGTQPREFKLGKDMVVPMSNEAPLGLKLYNSLKDAQKKSAMIGKKRANLIAAAGKDGFVPKPIGVSCKDFTKAQRDVLLDVIGVYVGDLPEPYNKHRMEELSSEIDKMSFSWWGPSVEKGDFSYRIQGPSLIIEYAGQDLGGDPHDHLHSMYRDPTNEYGSRLGK